MQRKPHPTIEVTISTSPEVGATFHASGHLVPEVDIGLSALGGAASTSIFLNLDAQADFGVSTASVANPQPCVNASTNINVGVGAQGSFFDLFDSSVSKSLFNKDFPLFNVRARSFLCPHGFSFPFLFSHLFPHPLNRARQQCFDSANSSSTASPATVTLSSSKRSYDSLRTRHPGLFGRSSRPVHAKRVGLSCP
jgi:hypothetical protein